MEHRRSGVFSFSNCHDASCQSSNLHVHAAHVGACAGLVCLHCGATFYHDDLQQLLLSRADAVLVQPPFSPPSGRAIQKYTTFHLRSPAIQPDFARLLTALFIIGICFSSLSMAATAPINSSAPSNRAHGPARSVPPEAASIRPAPISSVRRRSRLPGNASSTSPRNLFTTSNVNRTAVTLITHSTRFVTSPSPSAGQTLSAPQRAAAPRQSRATLKSVKPMFPTFSPRPDVRFDYAFENSCSKQHMFISSSNIAATGNISQGWFGPYSWQRERPPHMFPLKIGKKFICFDAKSKLIVRDTVDYEACNFIITTPTTDSKVLLKLASRPEWAVGFKKTGEAMLGKQYSKRLRTQAQRNRKEPECFTFILKERAKVTASAPSRQPNELSDAERGKLKGIPFVPRRTPAMRG